MLHWQSTSQACASGHLPSPALVTTWLRQLTYDQQFSLQNTKRPVCDCNGSCQDLICKRNVSEFLSLCRRGIHRKKHGVGVSSLEETFEVPECRVVLPTCSHTFDPRFNPAKLKSQSGFCLEGGAGAGWNTYTNPLTEMLKFQFLGSSYVSI